MNKMVRSPIPDNRCSHLRLAAKSAVLKNLKKMNAKRTLRNWIKAALRPGAEPKPRSSASIICDAVPLLIRTQQRLMKLAPLLFDADRIEAAVSKRLDDVLFKVKF